MPIQFDEFADLLTTFSEGEQVWDEAARFCQSRGFSGCSLVVSNSKDGKTLSPKIMSNFSNAFKTAYEKEGLGEIDPFLHFNCNTLSAKKIVSKDLSSFPDAPAELQTFLDQAAANGAINNIGIPVRTRDGKGVFGGWILSNTDSEEQFHQLDREYGRELHLAAVMAYERMAVIGLGETFKFELLSPREKECLLWLCAGLRTIAIADKLSISESAVNLYVNNAKLKLGAKTREQAIARAIFSGEIVI